MEKLKVLIDSDVLLNWLIKEQETKTGKNLWEAPYRIISLAQNDNLICYVSLISLMELQFVLRRKKKRSEVEIELDLDLIVSELEILIPDEVTLVQAYNLQKQYFLDPFDSILLSQLIGHGITLVSRDKDFIEKAIKVNVSAYNPEIFIDENY
jgi:PIN domain nuclease of toxin-antitoxin system